MVSRRLLLGLAGAASVLLCTPAPAQAHPFGDPQTLELSAEGTRVVAEWRVGGVDDLTLLAVGLGLLPENRLYLDGAVRVEPGDADVLAAAPEFRDYLLEHIELTNAGRACRGTVADASDPAEGVRLHFTCPGLAEDGGVDVTSTMLTDLHPAYLLLATGPDGQRAQHDIDDPTHGFVLGAAPASTGGTDDRAASGADLGAQALVQVGAVLGGLAAAGAAGRALLRLRRRRTATEGADAA